ncbi:MAG: hypothetical protein KKB13_20445 [Chloroflexi bacterium]|nr:hypothetical protein [Chloroflexota bacterium]
MRLSFRRRRQLGAIIASHKLDDIRRILDEQLRERHVRWTLVGEPRSTDGIYRLIDTAPRLVVVDPPDQLLGEMDWQLVAETLQRGGIPYVQAATFLADPASWIEQALAANGDIEALQPQAAAFVAYAGGVGKTTITLDTAVAFAHRTHLPVLAVEFCHGTSAFRAFCDPDLPDLFACAAEGQQPGTWRGITMVPLDVRHAVDLPANQVTTFLTHLARQHTLTLVDVSGYPHFLLDAEPLPIQQWWIVGDATRPDTLENAAYLKQQRPAAAILLNRAGRLDPAAWGFPGQVQLPRVRQAHRLTGQLGAAMLPHIFPGWRR